ncbi:unnamed protein product [Ilex paraguariensis]|uniref:Uncharacterized protein n=1 Tax=Ilex paraguariensis TaxID=185542 RepID=A0ABC8V5X7_9AQUA
MCMGFYHVIPTDSETVRHLKQVHGRPSTIETVQGDVEVIYRKCAPFQFLAYWYSLQPDVLPFNQYILSEVWLFYEERFGKLSEMLDCDYKLITAANMIS